MSEWVLILLLTVSTGAGTSQVVFQSEEECERAARIAVRDFGMSRMHGHNVRVNWLCLERSLPSSTLYKLQDRLP